MLFGPPDDIQFSPTKTMDDNHGEGPSGQARPPSPSPTGSVIDVGTLSDAARIQNLENGDYPNDDDDTRSLSESIRGHIIRGGLRYHAYHAGKYAFPNDETEQYRDDLKHTLTLHLCDERAFFAPVEDVLANGAEVLDLGKFRDTLETRLRNCWLLVLGTYVCVIQVLELGNGAWSVRYHCLPRTLSDFPC